tara:strand:- start:523 stop:762 length:240 start_codon:yes stop_codon:yes gene_type:complete
MIDNLRELSYKVNMKDDRGSLDLTKQIDNLKLTIQFYQSILRDAQKQIWYWKRLSYDNTGKDNLIEGMKSIIERISKKK